MLMQYKDVFIFMELAPSLTIAMGGIIETAIVPYHILRLISEYPELQLYCAATPSALKFVTKTTLYALTRHDVYDEALLFANDGKPAHLTYSSSQVTLIYPATARILAECALGIISCPVTRVFAFADKHSTIVTPILHPRMDSSLYSEHIQKLQNVGCTIILPSQGITWTHESSWVKTRAAVIGRLDLAENAVIPSAVSLF